jgi:hypothetical protein
MSVGRHAVFSFVRITDNSSPNFGSQKKNPLVSNGERVFTNSSKVLYPHAGGDALQQQQQAANVG